jgi:PKD repeat protein
MGNAQSDTTFLIKNIPSGTYFWSVQAVDQGYLGGNWSAVDSFKVKNIEAFFSSDEVCNGNPTHFIDQSVANEGIASWRWDFSDGETSDDQNPIHTYDMSGTFNVKLLITDTNGNKDSLIQAVIIKPKPVADFSAPDVCQGTPVTITNTTEKNGLTITSWYWDFGDGQTSLSEQPSAHGYLGAAEYKVLLKTLAENGCRDSISKNVTVSSYPIAAVTSNGSLSFCKGDSVILSVGYNTDYSYQWLLDGTGQTDADSSKLPAKLSGNYSVIVTNNTGNCQTISSISSVIVKDMPIKPVIQSVNYNEGDCPDDKPVRLSVNQTVTEYNYQWYRNGVPLNASTLSYIEGFLKQGDYSLIAELNGCNSTSDIFPIIYKDAPETPSIIAYGPTIWYLVCNTSSAVNYKWYYNGKFIPDADKYFYVARQNLGKYNVGISNEKGCFSISDTISIPIKITGIEDPDPFADVKIYPNPTTGMFTIEMNNNVFGELVIDIITQNGSKILNIKFEKTTEHFQTQIDLSGQGKGMYLINLSLDEFRAVRKVVVE